MSTSAGENRFKVYLIDAIHENMSVCLTVPLNFNDQLLDETRERFDNDIEWHCPELNEQDPLEFLYDIFEIPHPLGEIPNWKSLLSSSNFQGKAIQIKCETDTQKRDWMTALRDFCVQSKNISEGKRTKLLIIIKGPLETIEGDDDILECAKIQYKNFVSRADIMQAAQEISFSPADSSPDENSIRKPLTTSIVSELALWDTDLARDLAKLDLKDLFDPYDLLREYKDTNLPDPSDYDHEINNPLYEWQMGWRQTIDGENKMHSLVLATLGKKQAIERRVWRGQLSVILPRLENERRALLKNKNYKFHLSGQHTNKEGKPIDYDDLEWGNIYRVIFRKRYNLNLRDIRLDMINSLKEARNALAHFKPVKSVTRLVECLDDPPWR